MTVPFLDMKRMHEPLTEEFVGAFKSILSRSAFVNAPEVAQFEASFAKWTKAKYCLGMSSGLDAETIGLRAMGLKKGEKVLVPAMTFIATSEAVTHAGGIPAFVDVDREGLMDLNLAETILKKEKIAVLFPVHLFGQMVDPDGLKTLSQKYGVKIFEDTCQAHGATYKGQVAGTVGDVSAFSFYPGKNLGALGDGGALCTNDDKILATAKALREHGQVQKNVYEYEGYTARLDSMQAAFLEIKLKHLDTWTKQRIEAAKIYAEELSGMKNARLQAKHFDGRHVYHLMVVLTPERQKLVDALTAAKIGFGFHYPITLPSMPCYKDRVNAGDSFPNATEFANNGLSLPIFPGITREEIQAVCRVVKSVC